MTKHEGFFSTDVSFKLDATDAQKKADAALTKGEFDAIEWIGVRISNCATTGRYQTSQFVIVGLSEKIVNYFVDLGYKVTTESVHDADIDDESTETFIVGHTHNVSANKYLVRIIWEREGAV